MTQTAVMLSGRDSSGVPGVDASVLPVRPSVFGLLVVPEHDGAVPLVAPVLIVCPWPPPPLRGCAPREVLAPGI